MRSWPESPVPRHRHSARCDHRRKRGLLDRDPTPIATIDSPGARITTRRCRFCEVRDRLNAPSASDVRCDVDHEKVDDDRAGPHRKPPLLINQRTDDQESDRRQRLGKKAPQNLPTQRDNSARRDQIRREVD